MPKKNNPGCNCCGGSSICSVSTTIVFHGCGTSLYTGGGTYEIRRTSGNVLFYSGTLPASGSETITFTPPTAPPFGSNQFLLYYFPTNTHFDDNVGSVFFFGMFCGDNGTQNVTLGERIGFACCQNGPSPTPKTLYLSDNAGTTTLTGTGTQLGGTATISTAGKTTASGCTSSATVTVQVQYLLTCGAQSGGPGFLYPMGQLKRTYSYCIQGTTLAEGFRDKDDDPTGPVSTNVSTILNASSAPNNDPFFGTYPDDAYGILGTATVTA